MSYSCLMRKYQKRQTAIAYYRVSKKAKNDIRMQRKVCNDFCKKQNIRLVEEYIDKNVSGRTKNRPALKKLIEDINTKKVDSILVYKVDRLGRNFSQLNMLLETFENRNIQFISATQNFDNSTPEGKFMLKMMIILAELESNMISTRVLDGLRASRKKNRS